MCPLFKALELSKTIKKIEVAETHFKEHYCFSFSEILSDLKFKKIETLERFFLEQWFIGKPE